MTTFTKPSYKFIQGMIDGAKLELKYTSWYEFGKRNQIKGFIMACEIVLNEFGSY